VPGSTSFIAASLVAGIFAGEAAAQGIYTCVDAKGRKITSDRPILDCIDREQKELSPTGTVKRILRPSMTADEAAAEEERQRREAEEKARLAEEKKRNRALLSRYPDRAAHDRERSQAQAQVGNVIALAQKRTTELQEERRKLEQEAEFYKGDQSKFPTALKRQFEQNEQALAAQKRFVDNQAQELQRVNARFDEELVMLNRLWADQKRAATAAAASAPAKR
jgi:hypothetical protein